MPPSRTFRDDAVYPPLEDTYLLIRAAKAEVRRQDRILEIGCGSGAVSADLLNQAVSVVATDINPHAVESARQKGVDVVRTDLTAGIRGQFDLILFNPPYLPTLPGERVDDWLEYALDGGPDGRAIIARCIPLLPPLLSSHGRVLLLISSLTGIDAVIKLFQEAGFTPCIAIQEPLPGEDLLVIRAELNCRFLSCDSPVGNVPLQ